MINRSDSGLRVVRAEDANHRGSRHPLRAPLALVVVCLSVLSAATKFPDYPVRHVSDCVVKSEIPGLRVGVIPLDRTDQETYFRTDLGSKGITPVLVVMENSSSGDSFLFDKTQIAVGSANEVSPDVTRSLGRKVLAGGVSPLFMAHDYDRQQNIVRRELRSATISPGASVQGFLYVPGTSGSGGHIHIRIPITKVGSDDPLTIDLLI